MRNKILKTIGIILIIIGIIILVYLLILRLNSNKSIKDSIEILSKDTETNPNLDELYKKFQEYNIDLYENGQEIVDAFSYEVPDFNLMEYGFNENIVGYIEIPKIDITLPIYLGASKENLNKGATHLSKTSMPIGGENTNTVIAAHRGLIRNKMFRDIDKLEIGDEIIVVNFWEELVYSVSEIKIINPEDMDEILIQDGRDLITLFSCHPFRINTQRYVVYCERIEY